MIEKSKSIIKAANEKMESAVLFLEEDLKTYRAGKANPSVFNSVMVNYYGSPTPLNQVASINVPDAKTMLIQPWEKNLIPVIEKAIRACIDDSHSVDNISGMALEDICDQYIDRDIPVILWATINMLETNPKNSWYLSDGTRFTWPGNEHCMLLVGYDDTQYYFNDPYTGKLVAYDKTLTKDRFAELGRQAVVVFSR